MQSKLRQFNTILNEGISQEDLAYVLYDRLNYRYPDLVTRYGLEVVGDTIDDVASFYAGAEELGSSDINIMMRQILTKLEQYNQDIDETKGLPYPGTYEQENNMFKTSGPRHLVAMTNEEHCPHCGGQMVSEELMNEKKDACYYKVKSRYKVWPSAYASGALVKCRKKGASNWGTGGQKNESSILEGLEQVDENLHQWFKEKWVRFGPDGKIRGDCARGDDSEGKPKCLPQSKAHSLGKKGRASAASRKRREDPNPERSGKAINVNTKKKSNEGVVEQELDEACWKGYHKEGNKKMFGKTYPNCVKNKNKGQ